MDWDDLRYFLKVAETGGLLPAGRALRVNASTVGRHVEALETCLGRRLFQRTHQGYQLTEAGERLLQWSQRVAAEFNGLHQALGAHPEDVAGAVSIATTEPLAIGFLVPSLAALRHRHPAIEVEVAIDVESANLSRREADVALRVARPVAGNVVARQIGEVGYAFYASPAYVAEFGVPSAGDGFDGHRLIEWPLDHDLIVQVVWVRRVAARAVVVLRSTSGATRLAAARAGLGVALLPCLMVENGHDALVRVEVGAKPPPLALWTAAHADLAHLPRVRAVLDHLTTAATGEARRLRGDAVARSS